MSTIKAVEIVGTGFPPDEGKRLARTLLDRRDLDWPAFTIDLTGLSPSLLISAFFNGFLQEVFDTRAEWLERAKKIGWKTKFSFQHDNLKRWMHDFKPYVAQKSAGA